MIFSRGHACEDALVREEGYPVGAALDTRFVGRNSAGDTQRKWMLDGLARSEIERERLLSIRKVDSNDRQVASAAGGEQETQAHEDDCPDMLHFEQSVTRRIPSSKLYGHERWLPEDVRIKGCESPRWYHLQQTMDFVEAREETLEEWFPSPVPATLERWTALVRRGGAGAATERLRGRASP